MKVVKAIECFEGHYVAWKDAFEVRVFNLGKQLRYRRVYCPRHMKLLGLHPDEPPKQ